MALQRYGATRGLLLGGFHHQLVFFVFFALCVVSLLCVPSVSIHVLKVEAGGGRRHTEENFDFLVWAGGDSIILTQCIASYPTALLNLRRLTYGNP